MTEEQTKSEPEESLSLIVGLISDAGANALDGALAKVKTQLTSDANNGSVWVRIRNTIYLEGLDIIASSLKNEFSIELNQLISKIAK